ncbi:hypothetical protein BGX38DRAFT_1214534, partial [Terfezia claveryi]
PLYVGRNPTSWDVIHTSFFFFFFSDLTATVLVLEVCVRRFHQLYYDNTGASCQSCLRCEHAIRDITCSAANASESSLVGTSKAEQMHWVSLAGTGFLTRLFKTRLETIQDWTQFLAILHCPNRHIDVLAVEGNSRVTNPTVI